MSVEADSKTQIILLAEDDPDQSEMLRDTLEDEGYSVEAVFDGRITLERLISNEYGLVILDIRMPGLDGSRVLKELRQKAKNPDVPVIVVSAFASSGELMGYAGQGADATLAKPYALEQLLALVEKFLPSSGGP